MSLLELVVGLVLTTRTSVARHCSRTLPTLRTLSGTLRRATHPCRRLSTQTPLHDGVRTKGCSGKEQPPVVAAQSGDGVGTPADPMAHSPETRALGNLQGCFGRHRQVNEKTLVRQQQSGTRTVSWRALPMRPQMQFNPLGSPRSLLEIYMEYIQVIDGADSFRSESVTHSPWCTLCRHLGIQRLGRAPAPRHLVEVLGRTGPT